MVAIMQGLPVFPNRTVNVQDRREFTHAWAQQAVLDLNNLAEYLQNHAACSNLRPHDKSCLRERIANVRKRFDILEKQQDLFDFNYFTASKKPVRVFGEYHANYHVAAQEALFRTVRNVFYDSFSIRLSSNETEQDVQRIDVAYIKRITDGFCEVNNLSLENAAAKLMWLSAALGIEVGLCIKKMPTTPEKPKPPEWPPPRGWDFQAGKASYNGKEFPVAGIEWKLLKALAAARNPLTRDQLGDAGWEHDDHPSPDRHNMFQQHGESLLRSQPGYKAWCSVTVLQVVWGWNPCHPALAKCASIRPARLGADVPDRPAC
jgi:hypothetical protein